jgi:hypothetical protein
LFAYDELDKTEWNLKEFVNTVKLCTINKQFLNYVSDYLHINTFILDLEKDSLMYVGNDNFKYRKNVFLLKIKEDSFEPLIFSESRYIDYNSEIIKKLTTVDFISESLDCTLCNNVNILFNLHDNSNGFEEETNINSEKINNLSSTQLSNKDVTKISKKKEEVETMEIDKPKQED